MRLSEYTQQACPICGAASYSWGEIYAQSLNYRADDASLWEKINPFGGQLRARHCNKCGNIQLFSIYAESPTDGGS